MIVLDTHVWLWWVSTPDRLPGPVTEALAKDGVLGVSAVSCWEVAMLVQRGRIELDREPRHWVQAALAIEGVVALPLEPDTAVEAGLLGRSDFPGDPADRMIYATAKSRGALLATRDRELRRFDRAGTLWKQ